MPLSEADVQASLRSLIDPNTGRDFVTDKAIRKITIAGGRDGSAQVAIDVLLAYPAKSQHEALRTLIRDRVATLPGVAGVTVTIAQKIASHAVQRGVKLIPGDKNIIAIARGKGGVGKSTTD